MDDPPGLGPQHRDSAVHARSHADRPGRRDVHVDGRRRRVRARPKTGAIIWEYRSGLDQAINTACCGWDNRGVAVANGLVYVGRLDGAFMALDAKTGHLEWQTQVGRWQDGYTITSAPLYYNGVVYTGISGGEYGVRGKLTALDAGTGQELWHFWTIPGPGDIGGDTWPSPNDPGSRQGGGLHARRRDHLAAPDDRSRSRADLLQHGQRGSGLRRLGPTWRQPVQRLDGRAAPGRHVRVALPAGAATTSGTSTRQARRSCTTRSSTASRSRPSPRRARPVGSTCSIAPMASRLVGMEDKPVQQVRQSGERARRSRSRSAMR